MFIENLLNIFYYCCCESILLETVIDVFCFIITFFKNKSHKGETKAVLVSLSIFLLVAASFCIDHAHTEENVGHHSKIRKQGACENEYKKICLKVAEGSYLVDEDIVC